MVQTLFYLQTMVTRNHGLPVYTRHHKNWERSYKSSKDQQQLEQRETQGTVQHPIEWKMRKQKGAITGVTAPFLISIKN